MGDGNIREKRYIILHVDQNQMTACVINSHINQFIKKNPKLARCQVTMNAETHDFMDHMSHVDCSRTWVYSTDSVVDELERRTDWVLGAITKALRDELIAAFKFAPTLSSAAVNMITEALRDT